MKIQIERLSEDSQSVSRDDVDFGEHFLGILVITEQGEFRLSETDGRLQLHASGGQCVVYPQATNTLEVEIRKFGMGK